MFGVPISFIVGCSVFAAWCALNDHLNGRNTPTIKIINFVLEIVLLIYTVWTFGILKGIIIAVAYIIVGGLFGVIWDMLGMRKDGR